MKFVIPAWFGVPSSEEKIYYKKDLLLPYQTIRAQMDALNQLVPHVTYNLYHDQFASDNQQALAEVEQLLPQIREICLSVDASFQTANQQLLELSEGFWKCPGDDDFTIASAFGRRFRPLYDQLQDLRNEWNIFLEFCCIRSSDMQVVFPEKYFPAPCKHDVFMPEDGFSPDSAGTCNTRAGRGYHATMVRKYCTAYTQAINGICNKLKLQLKNANDVVA